MNTHIENRVTNYYTFSPETVSAYLDMGDWTGCWTYLGEMLESLSPINNAGLNIMLQKDMEKEDEKIKIFQFSELLGELIFVLLSDESSKLPDKSFLKIISCHEVLHNLLYLFGKTNPNIIARSILDDHKKLSDTQQKKVLLLLNLRDEIDIVSILKRIDSKYRIPAVAAYFSYNMISDKHVYNNKVKLYALKHDLSRTHEDYKIMSMAIAAYFNCSYLNIPEKHSIKIDINKAIQSHLNAMARDFKRIRSSVSQVSRQGNKLRMVVLMEFLFKEHAMTRSWSEWIKSLESEFDLTIIGSRNQSDEAGIAHYKNVEIYKNIGELVQICHRLAPDVLVIPSVGMTYYGVVSSNLRLAPLQIMGLGHPATSMSPCMDFVYGPWQMYHPDAFPKDRYISDNSPYKFFPQLSREDVLAITPSIRQPDDKSPFKITVVGTHIKLSSPFIELLKEIESESPFPVHFSFQIGSAGLDTLCTQKYFESQFKNMTYSGFKGYKTYLEKIKDADIILNPFPFGHTNTLIDTLLLGKPCMGLKGVEPASQTESYILDILGLENEFSANSIEDYKQKFFVLADLIRAGHSPDIDRGYVYDTLYSETQAFDFGKVIKWVYDNRTGLHSAKQKCFRVFENFS